MEDAVPEDVTPDQQATETAKVDEPNLGDAGKNAIRAEREARKAAEDAAKSLQAQLDQIKQSQMSDLERVTAQAQEYQKQAEKAASEALRWRIAARHGISDDDAATFLSGSDEATLTRQAERLAALSAATTGTPKPDLTQGGSGAPAPAGPEQEFANFLRTQLA